MDRAKGKEGEWGKNKVIGTRVRVQDTEWEIDLFGVREKKKQSLYRERRDHERMCTNTD